MVLPTPYVPKGIPGHALQTVTLAETHTLLAAAVVALYVAVTVSVAASCSWQRCVAVAVCSCGCSCQSVAFQSATRGWPFWPCVWGLPSCFCFSAII